MKRHASVDLEKLDAKRTHLNTMVHLLDASSCPLMDIWQELFIRCDGMSLVSLIFCNTRFLNRIMYEDSQLRAILDSPEGLLERVIISEKVLRQDDLPMIELILPAAFQNGLDIERIARLLVRISSTGLSCHVLTQVANEIMDFDDESIGMIQCQFVDLILMAYSSLHKLNPEKFPQNIIDFEIFVKEHELDMLAIFPLSSFLLPLTYFANSDIFPGAVVDIIARYVWNIEPVEA
jgi:hypothetical protein